MQATAVMHPSGRASLVTWATTMSSAPSWASSWPSSSSSSSATPLMDAQKNIIFVYVLHQSLLLSRYIAEGLADIYKRSAAARGQTSSESASQAAGHHLQYGQHTPTQAARSAHDRVHAELPQSERPAKQPECTCVFKRCWWCLAPGTNWRTILASRSLPTFRKGTKPNSLEQWPSVHNMSFSAVPSLRLARLSLGRAETPRGQSKADTVLPTPTTSFTLSWFSKTLQRQIHDIKRTLCRC